jgi:hypothetical protein
MKRAHLMMTAALTLAACGDTSPALVEPGPPSFSSGQSWAIFTTQTPGQALDASPGWEVATRFYATVSGCISHLHFYRASGETGTNYVKVWTNSGTLLYSTPIADAGTGWHTISPRPSISPPINDEICIPSGTYYRVSVNTNTKQAKTYGYLDNGPIINGPLVADYSYYGQPTGSMPTQGSTSIYFVGVTFREN